MSTGPDSPTGAVVSEALESSHEEELDQGQGDREGDQGESVPEPTTVDGDLALRRQAREDERRALRTDKARLKADCTRTRRALLVAVSQQRPFHEVEELSDALDHCVAGTLRAMARLSLLHGQFGDGKDANKVDAEMDALESEYSAAVDRSTMYLSERAPAHQTVTPAGRRALQSSSPVLRDRSDRDEGGEEDAGARQQESGVDATIPEKDTSEQQPDELELEGDSGSSHADQVSSQRGATAEQRGVGTTRTQRGRPVQILVPDDFAEQACQDSRPPRPAARPRSTTARSSTTDPGSAESRSRTTLWGGSNPLDIGTDLWRHMKRVAIPVFSGNKHAYATWKAAFIACIDSAPVTPEFKLLQLRQYLSGAALKAIDGLGHSAAAYEAAKTRLERKFGGERRQIATFMEDIMRFEPVRLGRAADLERFADLLDVTVVNLKDAGRLDELGDGTFYMTLQRKLPESLLTRYQRWAFEAGVSGTVETLQEWVTREAEFLAVATETIHGLATHSSGRDVNGAARPPRPVQKPRTYFGEQRPTRNRRQASCSVCGEPHGVWACRAFASMAVSRRWETAKRKRLCYRCLGEDHVGRDCRRGRPCGVGGCGEHHHRLLHRDSQSSQITAATAATEHRDAPEEQQQLQSPGSLQVPTEGERTLVAGEPGRTVAMRTVPVVLKAGERRVTVNALLDDASTRSYLNSSLAAELGLKGRREKVAVSVLNGEVETFETMPVEVGLESVDGQLDTTLTALTTNGVTGDLKAVDWRQVATRWPHLQGIPFPQLGQRMTVDILIGLDHADLHYSIRDVRGQHGQPIARLTPLGWTCVGVADGANTQRVARTFFVNQEDQISTLLQKFWEVESVTPPANARLTVDESRAVKIVKDSLEFIDGRYQVGLPWRQNSIDLPDNREMAQRRLVSTERRLRRDPAVAATYCGVIQQYLEKGYIRQIESSSGASLKQWYLPHFPIVKPLKTTTKVRIVFDASASHQGMALNDAVLPGPKLQRDLNDVLLRFRRQPVALVCDIAEMYLQIGLAPKDRASHRFLWRNCDANQPVKEYEFNRVVFGVNASPFLAQFVSQHHAETQAAELPLAADTVLKSTYMDDSMDSAADDEEGILLYQQLSELWRRAGMKARKWLSNSVAVLDQVPAEDRASEIDLDNSELPSVKTLGVLWSAADDTFRFQLQPPAEDMVITKRNVLRKVATIFDPLGFLAPFIVRGKILLQRMWAAGLEWDEPADDKLAGDIRQWFINMNALRDVRIRRCLQRRGESTLRLHVFADASEDAYGAVVYSHCEGTGGAQSTNIVVAKTRVAPLEAVSMPRLELMAAVVANQLGLSAAHALGTATTDVTYWSDSSDVLWWVRGRSRSYRPFVANRVATIHESSEPRQWRYIPGEINPADQASRGCSADRLQHSVLWWHGPAFLLGPPDAWPTTHIEPSSAAQKELKKGQHSFAAYHVDESDRCTPRLRPEHYSQWLRLTRMFAWVHRFIGNAKVSADKRTRGELTPDEIADAERYFIRQAQREHFGDELQAIRLGRELPARSKLAGLLPTLDDNGLLRANGRLQSADFLPVETRCPIILPRSAWLTKLIIRHYHATAHHAAGTNHLLSLLSSRYWIVSAREAIRECERECFKCKLLRAKTATQVMAPLPLARLETSLRAFDRAAVDFAGPFITIQGRGRRREKRYLCLFTCMATRAVHLELAFGLSTDAFLNAFYRMVSRRGLPREMWSDNGTNFVGAVNELRELIEALDHDAIVTKTADKGVKWHFNPPGGPHFGGVHESLVKSAKRALNAIVGNADLNDEELMTAIIGVEALLNSRPITYQSAHPQDDVPLTPNHFLHGQVGGEFAPSSVDETDFQPRRRWRRVQEVVLHFWRRWMREWLPSLSGRRKWLRGSANLQIGDVVLVVSPDTRRGEWPLGRVTQVYPGQDGKVRVVKLRVGEKEMVRPITKLCPLEVSSS